MKSLTRAGFAFLIAAILAVLVTAADIKIDLSKEQVGKPPATFEPMVGTWVVTQEGSDKVIMIDGRPSEYSVSDIRVLLR